MTCGPLPSVRHRRGFLQLHLLGAFMGVISDLQHNPHLVGISGSISSLHTLPGDHPFHCVSRCVQGYTQGQIKGQII